MGHSEVICFINSLLCCTQEPFVLMASLEWSATMEAGAVTSRPPPSIALTVLTESLICEGTFYCDPFNDRMEDPHTYGYIMCRFRVIRSLQTFCMTKCAAGQRSERLAFMGRSIFMTFSVLTTGNTLRALLPAKLSLTVLELNKSDGTCLCLESSRWSARGKKNLLT